MITHKKISKKTKNIPIFTGITIQQFNVIIRDVKKRHSGTEKSRLSKKERKRKIGAGRKFDHSVENRMVMLLAYYRMYITYELAGYLFNLDQANVYRNIKYLEPTVKRMYQPSRMNRLD